MNDKDARSGTPGRTLAERLASMSIADIDAMSDEQVAVLMDATPEEFATQPAWTWREAAKAATNEYADRLVAGVESGRVKVITDPSEVRRRLGGRPKRERSRGEQDGYSPKLEN